MGQSLVAFGQMHHSPSATCVRLAVCASEPHHVDMVSAYLCALGALLPQQEDLPHAGKRSQMRFAVLCRPGLHSVRDLSTILDHVRSGHMVYAAAIWRRAEAFVQLGASANHCGPARSDLLPGPGGILQGS